MYTPELIEQLKSSPANRLENIMEEDGIELTAGGGYLSGYHSNKHDSASKASLRVDSKQQLYKCFNCGEGGDVICWLELNRGKPFVEVSRTILQEPFTRLSSRVLSTRSVRLFEVYCWTKRTVA